MIDKGAVRQSYLFFLQDEPSLCKLVGQSGNILLPYRHTDFVHSYLDTPEKEYEQKMMQITRISTKIENNRIGGIDVDQHSIDNVWKTQSRRLIECNSNFNNIPFIGNSELKCFDDLNGNLVKTRFTEASFDINKTDIYVAKMAIPIIGKEYLRIGIPNAGRNFWKQWEKEEKPDLTDFEKDFHRKNYLNVLQFIEEAYSKNMITPVEDMPSVMIQKEMMRFG